MTCWSGHVCHIIGSLLQLNISLLWNVLVALSSHLNLTSLHFMILFEHFHYSFTSLDIRRCSFLFFFIWKYESNNILTYSFIKQDFKCYALFTCSEINNKSVLFCFYVEGNSSSQTTFACFWILSSQFNSINH